MDATPRYPLRARFCGILDWLCPWCGYLNRSRIDRTGWRVQCKGKGCRRQFAIGTIFRSLSPLRRSGRRYLPPPDVTFPLAELGAWESGAAVNRLVADTAPEQP